MNSMIRLSFLFLALSIIHPAEAATPFDSKEYIDDVGAINHISISTTLLRHGIQAEQIRNDILGNLKIELLSGELQGAYKKLLELATKIDIEEKNVSKEYKIKSDEYRFKKEKAGIKTAFNLLSLCANPTNPVTIMKLLDDSNQTPILGTLSEEIINELRNKYSLEFSGFEFDLAAKREALSRQYGINPNAFVTIQDVEKYIQLQELKSNLEVYRKELAALHMRAPAFYLVSFELGLNEFRRKDLLSAGNHLKKAIETSPVILRKVPVRSFATAYLGQIEINNGHFQYAYTEYLKPALYEMPDNLVALRGSGYCMQALKDYGKAAEYYQSFLSISKDDPMVNYNYACVLSLLGKNPGLIIDHIRRSMNAGFSNIRHIKTDPDLRSIHNLPEFSKITAIQYSYDLTRVPFTTDKFHFTNTSVFELTNVKIGIYYRLYDNRGVLSGSWYYRNKNEFTGFDRIVQNQEIVLDAYDQPIEQVGQIRLRLECDQGTVHTVYGLSNGRVMVMEHRVF